jgi:pimeloyl-ACP methyl ester carboxylesterase
MPYVDSAGVSLYYEATGSGSPIVFVHEFAGDSRSWEPQIRYFSRRYHTVSYNARGYPPSDVPESAEAYSQDQATDDIAVVMRALDLEKAHVVGLSMGGFAALHFGIRYPELARSIVVAGCGYGAPREMRGQFADEANAIADRIIEEGMDTVASDYGAGPTRVQMQNKDPRGWAEFLAQLQEHSSLGSANTMRGIQARRPSLYDLEEQLKGIDVPCLLVTGDEDEPCLDANIYMKRMIPTSGLVIMPRTGHACNLEEPALFNQSCQEFFSAVEQGRWEHRDPRSVSTSILSTDED